MILKKELKSGRSFCVHCITVLLYAALYHSYVKQIRSECPPRRANTALEVGETPVNSTQCSSRSLPA